MKTERDLLADKIHRALQLANGFGKHKLECHLTELVMDAIDEYTVICIDEAMQRQREWEMGGFK